MFNGCSWIKNFQLLSARWRKTRAGEIGGGVKERRECKGGGLHSHVYVCISALGLVIRRGKNQLPPKARRASHVLPTLRQRKHSTFKDDSRMCLCCFHFFTPRPPHLGVLYLDWPGQLAKCREVCAAPSIRLHIISRQFGAPDPEFRWCITANFCWMLMRSEILRQSNIS